MVVRERKGPGRKLRGRRALNTAHRFSILLGTAQHNKVIEILHVIPACFWRESRRKAWMPAFAGMTVGYRTPNYVVLH
jgi:hypothetical protein